MLSIHAAYMVMLIVQYLYLIQVLHNNAVGIVCKIIAFLRHERAKNSAAVVLVLPSGNAIVSVNPFVVMLYIVVIFKINT